MLNYYKILGIKESSTDEQIKNAYKKLALKWHPDKNKSKNAETKFQQIVEAYNVLGDVNKRKQYDNDTLDEINKKSDEIHKKEEIKPPTKKETFPIDDFNKQFQNFPFNNKGTNITTTTINGLPGGTTTINGMPDLDALFNQIFGPNNNMFSGIGAQVQQAINSVSNGSLNVQNTTSYPRQQPSSQQMNNGRPPPPTVHEIYCSLEELYNGTEKTLLVRDEYNDVELDVEIQPGTKDDTKIRFFKKGPSNEDVIFIIKAKDHNLFIRDLYDLHITFDLTLDEAKNGCSRTIKLLNNTDYTIKINKLKKSNDIQKISGYGMPIRGSKKKGDMIIHFNVLLN
jgi:DnaJ-class molecular chaperone